MDHLATAAAEAPQLSFDNPDASGRRVAAYQAAIRDGRPYYWAQTRAHGSDVYETVEQVVAAFHSLDAAAPLGEDASPAPVVRYERFDADGSITVVKGGVEQPAAERVYTILAKHISRAHVYASLCGERIS
jgi:hypothetical protein